jgi:dTDP-4-amino-4,6-dideoxygalactose transaminase
LTYFVILVLEKISPGINYRLYSGNIKVVLGKFENSLYSEFPNNYLLDYTEPQAYVGLHSFVQAEQATRKRIENGELLRQLLKEIGAIEIPIKLVDAKNVYWRFPIVSNDRDGLKKFLLDHGIDSAPTYLALCSKELGFEPYHQPTPVAERFKKNALVVEVNEKLDENDIRLIAFLVKSYFNHEKLIS